MEERGDRVIGDLYLQDPEGPRQKNALQSRDGERGGPTSNYDETDQKPVKTASCQTWTVTDSVHVGV